MQLIDKRLHYSKLLDFYSSLLTTTQKEILFDYFHYDLSLSEIGQNRNISRSAVEDAIKKGCGKLDELESSLALNRKAEKILKITAKLKEKFQNDKETLNLLEDIERNL